MRIILIWGGMFHVKHSSKKMWSLGLTTPDRRAGASAKAMCETDVLLAPFYVQNRPLSSLFCGVAQNFFNLNKSLRQCKSDVQNRPSPAPFYPQSLRVSSIICRYAQNNFNSRRSCHGVANMRKFKTIAQNKT